MRNSLSSALFPREKVFPMRWKRALAPFLFVILAFLAVPAMAQQGPSAAPVGAPATSQPLNAPEAAPTTNVDIGALGQVKGLGGGFSVVESFLSAGVIVKTV